LQRHDGLAGFELRGMIADEGKNPNAGFPSISASAIITRRNRCVG
jgi:hypothetical protein